MVGPSSSHTAGACRIAYTARQIIQGDLKKVTFILFESFAKTYRGHGTDLALMGGMLGYMPDDERIIDSERRMRSLGIEVEFVCSEKEALHPNTVQIKAETTSGSVWEVLGISIGGGKMVIKKLSGIDITYTGEYNTLVTHHRDKSGMLASITKALAEEEVNIASTHLYREEKGLQAIGIIETDETLENELIEKLTSIEGIDKVTVIPKIY